MLILSGIYRYLGVAFKKYCHQYSYRKSSLLLKVSNPNPFFFFFPVEQLFANIIFDSDIL